MTTPKDPSLVRRTLARLGLAFSPDGAPRTPGRRPSRYGPTVSRRVDEDVDALRARVAALEARLDARSSD
ncbi:hypothetical protein [Luteimicrobium subarcticum]|nr:hypothetical protein [Luteimicrobium subarcticum]